MPLKAHNPRMYDHTDGDIIVIHSERLSSHFKELSREIRLYGLRILFIVVAMVLWGTVIIVEEFKTMGSFSGEGVRAGLVIAAAIGTFLAIQTTVTQYFRRDRRDHDWYISNLTSVKPMTREEFEASVWKGK